VARWPAARITLRQAARVIEDSRRLHRFDLESARARSGIFDCPWRAKMPLRGRDHTFALANCRALLFKLEREIKRYRKTDASDSAAAAEMTDLAFNISVTAWHLCDWVFEDMNDNQRKQLGIRKLSHLQTWALGHRPLHLCRQLATGSKHWEVSQHPDPDVKAVVCHSGAEWRIYIKGGDKEFHAIEVFEAAYDCWANFIYTNRIAANQDPFDEI
jgi:hypothetical protein